MTARPPLPANQFEAKAFVRFGLGKFRRKQIDETLAPALCLSGDVANAVDLQERLAEVPRHEQVSDFHCVTTWSVRGVRWSGWRFADVHEQLIKPLASPDTGANLIVLRGSDGYCCAMQLQDLLRDDVLLADRLDGEPLGVDHGAPIRLVAPAHYGYKSVKHLVAIEYWKDRRNYRFPFPYPGFIDHPRGRVAFEERARLIPNALLRPIYRFLIPRSVRKQIR